MASAELFDILLAVCATGFVLGLVAWRVSRLERISVVWTWFAFGLAALTWALRWTESGHWPIFGTWESGLSVSLAVLMVAIGWSLRTRAGAPLVGAFMSAVAAGILVHARAYDSTAYALTISERSWVLDLHAAVAWLAFGSFALNAGQSLAVVLRRERTPSRLSLGLRKSLLMGFVLHSAMLAAGSIYKFLLFGRAWSFDPIETLGLSSWLAYGTLLHLERLGGWSIRRLAGWCLAVFVLLVISYRAIVFYPAWSTYHIFDIDLRIHVTGAESQELE